MDQSRYTAAIDAIQVRDSGAASGAWTFTGHAAVFNRFCDFGAFEEQIAPGAFTNALQRDPLEVMAVLNHDPGMILGATMNNTLEMKEDPIGLRFWARPPATTLAADTRVLVEEGYLQQASFKFTIANEVWEIRTGDDGQEEATVTITEIGTLYDVSLCGLGAYSQTDVTVQSHARLRDAISEGRVPGLTLDGARERGIVIEEPERSREAGEEDAAPETVDVADERSQWLAQAREAHQSAEMLTAARAV